MDDVELFERIAPEIRDEIRQLLKSGSVWEETCRFVQAGYNCQPFDAGLLLRLLYSALIDADRTDAAGSAPKSFQNWSMLAARLEERLAKLPADSELDRVRREISDALLGAAGRERGIYRMTIPTGGGKTLAGLRFALNHAARHGLKRVIYAAPFLSILEQNAGVFRRYLDDPGGDYVLEFHSNVLPEGNDDETPRDILAEPWDAPVICTTMVQVLNAMFSGESRHARRFHQFSDAVILLDEIQSLPLELFHLFNRAANFIAERMHSTMVLCSATQPRLDNLDDEFGSLHFNEEPELYPGYEKLFRRLRRVDVKYVPDVCCNDGIAEQAEKAIASARSLLLVCNTKPHAAEMFQLLKQRLAGVTVFHLSTNLCAAHRRDTMEKLRRALRERVKLAVVSTSLIEAGVDVSFETVIRMMAPLDSIVQAAGRCNRNAEATTGRVYVLDNSPELDLPPSVKTGAGSAAKALRDYNDKPEDFDSDICSPKLLEVYYNDLYAQPENKKRMDCPVRMRECKDETLLNLLDKNGNSYNAFRQKSNPSKLKDDPRLRGAFRTAGEKFKAFEDLANVAVVVPYGEGVKLIADLEDAMPSAEKLNSLLRRAQMFTVNVTESTKRKLKDKEVIRELGAADGGRGVLVADKKYYDCEALGLITRE